MGYKFEIFYKEGKDNIAADALSRIDGSELLALTLNNIEPDFFLKIKASWLADPHILKLIEELKQDAHSHPKFAWKDDTLRRWGKLVIGNNPAVKSFILQWIHDSAIGSHSRIY